VRLFLLNAERASNYPSPEHTLLNRVGKRQDAWETPCEGPQGSSGPGQLGDECLITSKPVRELCGNCSEMHVWRLLNEEKYRELAFPKPFKINGRNYWRLGAVRRWVRDREAESPGGLDYSVPPPPSKKPQSLNPKSDSRFPSGQRKRHRRDHAYVGRRR
jgi:predicted DNA-binding transcriptional regulator AlpA